MQALLATRKTPIVGDMGFSGSVASSTVNSGDNCNGGSACTNSRGSFDVHVVPASYSAQASGRGVELGFGRVRIDGIGLGGDPAKCEVEYRTGDNGDFVEGRVTCTVDDPGQGNSMPKYATGQLGGSEQADADEKPPARV